MRWVVAHGGPGGLALELGAVIVPVVLLLWFAVWNSRHPQQDEAVDEDVDAGP